MTLGPFYSLLMAERAKRVKAVVDNIMAGKQDNQKMFAFG